MSKQVKLKVNCLNILYLEGYASDPATEIESKTSGEQRVLKFTLNHISLGKKQDDGTQVKYNTPFTVFVYGNRIDTVAPLVSNPLKLIMVEGKLRRVKGAGMVIIADFVKSTQPIVAEVTIEDTEEYHG